ncbi:MAG: hypothetical protein Q8S31_07620 [Alphaproteobacteria bacterium]|nr:hypothetical protein [Alphaproteobacteria bacterium]
MIRFLKKSLIFILIFYGIFYYILQIDYFSFNDLRLNDFNKKDQNYFLKLFSFLEERNYKKAFVLRDGEFLTYSNLNIQHIFDDKTIDFTNDINKIYDFDCIISNHYNDPIFYKTKLNDIINQYDKSSLVFDDLGYKVFELNKTNNTINSEGFKFDVSEIDFLKNSYFYLTHKNEYPSLLAKPDIKYDEFPILEDGFYDCICDMEIIANEDSIVLFSILNYESYRNNYILKDTLYLKKGKNNISTRFLTTSKPFRCLFSSKKHPISIENFKINFYKKENKFYDLNQIYPKTYSMLFDGGNIKSNTLIFFQNKDKNFKLINMDLVGDGEVFLSTLNLNGINKFLLKNSFNNFLIKILLFFNGDSSVLSIGQKSKIIEKNIPPNSILFLQFKKNHMNENANFVIQNIKIINGSEND